MGFKGKVFITGGTGTIGQAIIRRATEENWDCDITVFSRSWKTQADLKRIYPKTRCVLGDVLDPVAISMAIAGHDIVIHAAAMKHIVRGEEDPLQTYEVNVNGSIHVLQACVEHNIKQVVGISTDKACCPINAYGASKLMMEKIFQQFAYIYGGSTAFNLVRYGNVFGSAGSFIHNWRACQEAGEPVWSTDPEMTRFWLSEDYAVDLILHSTVYPTGSILVPLLKSAQIGDIESWILGKRADEYIGKRPGEKFHEMLVNREESWRTSVKTKDLCVIYPEYLELVTARDVEEYSSDMAPRFTKEEFLEMVGI